MNILNKLEEIMGVLPWDKVETNTLFIELDEVTFEEFGKEIEARYNLGEKVAFTEKARKVDPDVGDALWVTFMGRNLVIASNKRAKEKLDTFYVAFKTKLV